MLKKIGTFALLILVSLSVSNQGFASAINCSVDQVDGNGSDYSALLVDVVRGTCDNGAYRFEFSGIGLGLRITMGSAFGIACPFADGIEGVYWGIKADASVLVGLDTALFLGTHGLCAMGGINGLSIGADLSGTRLKITRQ